MSPTRTQPRQRLGLRWACGAVALLAVLTGFGFWVRGRPPAAVWASIEGQIGRGRWAEAQEQLERWVRRNPDDGRAWLNLGSVRVMNQQDDAALDAFGRVRESDPAYAEARLQIGEVWVRRRKPSAAER